MIAKSAAIFMPTQDKPAFDPSQPFTVGDKPLPDAPWLETDGSSKAPVVFTSLARKRPHPETLLPRRVMATCDLSVILSAKQYWR